MHANNAPLFDAEKYCYDIFGINITRIPGISGLTAFKLLSELGGRLYCKISNRGQVLLLDECGAQQQKIRRKNIVKQTAEKKKPRRADITCSCQYP